jgi:hypothetical protein
MSCRHKIKQVFQFSTVRNVRISSFIAKVVLIKVVYPLNICQHTKFHGPTLTGTSSASNSVV